jgi:hypothetical protein
MEAHTLLEGAEDVTIAIEHLLGHGEEVGEHCDGCDPKDRNQDEEEG